MPVVDTAALDQAVIALQRAFFCQVTIGVIAVANAFMADQLVVGVVLPLADIQLLLAGFGIKPVAHAVVGVGFVASRVAFGVFGLGKAIKLVVAVPLRAVLGLDGSDITHRIVLVLMSLDRVTSGVLQVSTGITQQTVVDAVQRTATRVENTLRLQPAIVLIADTSFVGNAHACQLAVGGIAISVGLLFRICIG